MRLGLGLNFLHRLITVAEDVIVGNFLVQENGDYILQENGDLIHITESGVYLHKFTRVELPDFPDDMCNVSENTYCD